MMRLNVCTLAVATPSIVIVWFRDVATVRLSTRPYVTARLPSRYAATETPVAVVWPWFEIRAYTVKGWFCRTVIAGLAGATVRSGPVRTWTARDTVTDFVLLPALIAGYGSKSTPPGPVVAPKVTIS